MPKLKPLRTMTIASACMASLLLPAFGQSGEGKVEKIILNDFIASVSINHTDASSVSIKIKDKDLAETPISIESKNGIYRISGQEEPNQKSFWKAYNKIKGKKRLEKYLQSRPSITIEAPRGTELVMEGLIGKVNSDGAGGDLGIINTLYVEADFERVEAANIHLTGSSEILIDDINQDANLKLSGSGDLDVGEIQGNAVLQLSGSGDIIIETIEGSVSSSLKGSGDIAIGTATSKTALSIIGSGDIQLEEAKGNLTLNIVGSGDIKIDDADKVGLSASIKGSGEIDFDGVAQNPVIAIMGSGEVALDDYEGQLQYSGKKENLHIKNRR